MNIKEEIIDILLATGRTGMKDMIRISSLLRRVPSIISRMKADLQNILYL